MTTIRGRMDGEDWRFEVNGHAGESDVCSAISMMCCALGAALGGECEAEPGLYRLCARVDSERKRGMIEMAMTGFRMLEGKYPGNVRIEE